MISIHAPREGSDIIRRYNYCIIKTFLSTLPARGATGIREHALPDGGISIHAPREGSDPAAPQG